MRRNWGEWVPVNLSADNHIDQLSPPPRAPIRSALAHTAVQSQEGRMEMVLRKNGSRQTPGSPPQAKKFF